LNKATCPTNLISGKQDYFPLQRLHLQPGSGNWQDNRPAETSLRGGSKFVSRLSNSLLVLLGESLGVQVSAEFAGQGLAGLVQQRVIIRLQGKIQP